MKVLLKRSFDFKVKVWHLLIAFVYLGSALTGCTDSDDHPDNPGRVTTTGDDASDKMPYQVTKTLVNNNGRFSQTVALRYYDDMPHVAYIAVTDFQSLVMPLKSIGVSRTGASQYLLTTSKGETAVVNTADETMAFDDFMGFVSVNWTNAEGFVLENDDNVLSFVRELPTTYTPAKASASFDMKKYGIDLRGDGQMVYVPLTTLSDIYSTPSCNHVLFNGEKILMTTFDTSPANIDEPFFQRAYEMTERPADLAAYSYGELCFAIDHFYGRPGRNAIDKTIEEKGIDQVLNDSIRGWLKSTNMNEYAFGLEYLSVLLNDGGHTIFSPIVNSILVGMEDMNKMAEYLNKYITSFEDFYPTEAKMAKENVEWNDGSRVAAKERKKLLGTDFYKKIGNTMYYIYDDFGPIDSKGWTAFYQGKGARPAYNPKFRGDICGIVEALDKAAADPEVENFVVDLTCNNGGDSGVLLAMTNLLAGKKTYPFENVLTQQLAEERVNVDSNFDGVFDETDNAPRHPQLNIAIMTSNYAYSCGNLLPSLMKDYGFLIIGEKTSGGSCSIQKMSTAEGVCYQMSSARMRIRNMAGENIDGGVEPHIALEVKKAKGWDDDEEVEYSDFSAFYDPSIGDLIVNWYKK